MGKMMIGERLRKLRTDRGWSQGAVADQIGVTTSAISMYENDQREPSFDIIEKLASLYCVSVDEIMFKSERSDQRQADIFTSKDGIEFGLTISRSNRHGNGTSVSLSFDNKKPILKVDGLSNDFASNYATLQPEDKIAVCREMLRRAKEELIRGI